MSTSFEEKLIDILENSDFNDLPYEERVRIGKYKAEQQILTLYQVSQKYSDVVTPAFKRKIKRWLESCVETYRKEYGIEKDMWAERRTE